jgi:CheY-like chemotaxis protein
MLQEEAEDVDQKGFIPDLEKIHGAGKHLLGLINDVLDLSKIEAGKLAVDRTPCSPVRLLGEVCSLLRPHAEERGLVLELDLAAPMPASIHTDPTRLRQILINLVGNALKFTHEGGVTLRARLEDGVALAMEVIDTGVGLSDDPNIDVFEAFSQADASASREFSGTGLGLTISRRLAALLGGGISVESTRGSGSVFRLTVATGPLDGIERLDAEEIERALAAADTPRSPVGVKNLVGRVLLAEDGPDNQRLIAAILRRAGLDVEVARNGRIAVELALNAENSEHPFDLVLMDVQMPELDGRGATRELRRAGFATPIVALTAHAMAGDRERCLQAGCDDYCTKPVRKHELLGVIAMQLEKRHR